MARMETNVNGYSRVDGQPNGTEGGSGYIIGDGYVITAGHVSYEWNRSKNNPVILESPMVVLDYRDYKAAYLSAVQSNIASGGAIPDNHTIEGPLYSRDVALVSRSSASTTSSSDGLATFINSSDALNVASVLGTGAKILRYGRSSDELSGNISNVNVDGVGTFRFSLPVQDGDSGGGYVITQGSRGYVFGVQSSNYRVNQIPQYAIANYLNFSEWLALNTKILEGKSGNLTSEEPQNLVVGSDGELYMEGSARPDLVLGRGGVDIISGDPGFAPAWGNDSLYGGDANDSINADRGNDMIHGGNRLLETSQQSALEADGFDSADYRPLTALDATTGVAIRVTDQAIDATLAANVDAKYGTYVTDRGRDGATDLLVSVEKITATAADDVLVVTKLDPARLAGADATGGLNRVDLGGQSGGDLIDLSNLNEAARVILYSDTPYLEARENQSLRVYVDGAEQVIGSGFNDYFAGSSAADTLAGGAGNDSVFGLDGKDTLFSGTSTNDEAGLRDALFGGRGVDTLVVQAGSNADLRGEQGGDKFVVSLDTINRRDIFILDSDAYDTLYWHGYQLKGGEAAYIEAYHEHVYYGYLDDESGIVYSWAQNQPTVLRIDLPDGTTIIDENWKQGDLGITLSGQVFEFYGGPEIYSTLRYSNICHNGVEGDFASLTGRQEALSNAGPNVEPVAPTPFDAQAPAFVAAAREDAAIGSDAGAIYPIFGTSSDVGLMLPHAVF